MSVAHSVAEVLRGHVTLELECIDRMYLNACVPKLQYDEGVSRFFRFHRGHRFASSALMEPITRAFVAEIQSFALAEGIPIVEFEKDQRKDEVAAEYLAEFTASEGVLFIGKAQEKARVFRTVKRRNSSTGTSYVWIQKSSALVNHYYFYAVDQEFGPFFLKFCSYFPYNAKLCINGHEYLKRQLAKRGMEFEPLDNGIFRCADPERAQQIAEGLTAAKIDRLLRRWLRRLPHPFTAKDLVGSPRRHRDASAPA